MNRAILIVICDFLVSAMLSMMTGMVPAHTGGTGVGLDERTTRLLLGELELRQQELENLRRQLREAAARGGRNPESTEEVRKITQELIDNMRRIEQVKRAQRATAANTGKVSAEELQKKLEAEARKRLELEIKLRDKMLDSRTASDKLAMTRTMLEKERQRLSATEKQLAETTRAERSANAELRQLAADYRAVQKQLGASEADRRLTERELAAARNAIAARDADLAGVKNALREMNNRIGKVSLERQELQRTLAFTTGKLNTAERDNADYKGRLRQLERLSAQQKIELAAARQEKMEMEVFVKRSTESLSKAQTEAAASKLAAKKFEGQLEATQKILKDMRRSSATDAFKRYSEAAIKLNYEIVEDAAILTRSVKEEYVSVLVKFGSKTLAVAPLEQLIGAARKNLLYRKIKHLSYTVSAPDGKHKKVISTPLLAIKSRFGEYLGALELSVPGREPLKVITREELKNRGIADLFLFSCRKFGSRSAALGERCSLAQDENFPYLLIRNDRSRNSAHLNAEPGDIVITRDGGFVGVVNAVDSKTYEARVLLFSDPGIWANAFKIPVSKRQGEQFADGFGEAVRKFRFPQR